MWIDECIIAFNAHWALECGFNVQMLLIALNAMSSIRRLYELNGSTNGYTKYEIAYADASIDLRVHSPKNQNNSKEIENPIVYSCIIQGF